MQTLIADLEKDINAIIEEGHRITKINRRQNKRLYAFGSTRRVRSSSSSALSVLEENRF